MLTLSPQKQINLHKTSSQLTTRSFQKPWRKLPLIIMIKTALRYRITCLHRCHDVKKTIAGIIKSCEMCQPQNYESPGGRLVRLNCSVDRMKRRSPGITCPACSLKVLLLAADSAFFVVVLFPRLHKNLIRKLFCGGGILRRSQKLSYVRGSLSADLESCLDLICILSRLLPAGTEGSDKTPARVADLAAEIRTEHLLNRGLERLSSASCLGAKSVQTEEQKLTGKGKVKVVPVLN
jgi:hypothetical protein